MRITQFLGKCLSVFLLATAVLLGTAFSDGTQSPAIAKPMTPEAAAYEIDHADSPEAAGRTIRQQARDYKQELRQDANYTQQAAKSAAKGTQNKLEQAADTIREKLNLDEPVPQSTKDFLNDTRENVDAAVRPVTGK